MRFYRLYFSLIQQGFRRTWGRLTVNDYSAANTIGFISAVQIANAFYLIEEVLFTEARGCGACNAQGRFALFCGAVVGIYVTNNVLFWREPPDSFTPLSRQAKWGWALATLAYCVGSVYLVV